MTDGLRWNIRHPLALAAVTVVVVVLALPQVGVVWNRAAFGLPLAPDAACHDQVSFEPGTLDYIYGCELHQAFRLDPLSLGEAAHDGLPRSSSLNCSSAVFVVAAALWLPPSARPCELPVPSDASL